MEVGGGLRILMTPWERGPLPARQSPHLVGGCGLEPSQVRFGPSGWCPELEWPRAPFVPSHLLNSSSRTPAARGFSWATVFGCCSLGRRGQVEGKQETTYLGDVQALGGDLAGRSEMAGRRGWAGRERHQERLRLELGPLHGPPLGPGGQG